MAAASCGPLRLVPGDDLRVRLDEELATLGQSAAFVLAGIGSLSRVRLRLAGTSKPIELEGDFEILTLSGTLSLDGSHLHMSVSDGDGRVRGGHVATGCLVLTTAELLIALLPGWTFTRELDPATGYAELTVRRQRPV